MHPGVAQCRNCWHWGHPTYACCAQGAKCQKCGGPHRVENYRLLAWYYKAIPKSNPSKEATAAGAPSTSSPGGQEIVGAPIYPE